MGRRVVRKVLTASKVQYSTVYQILTKYNGKRKEREEKKKKKKKKIKKKKRKEKGKKK